MAELIAQEGAVVPVGQPICSIETADAASALGFACSGRDGCCKCHGAG